MENNKAQESRNAIERLFIEMRHIFNSGSYKPGGLSGKVINEALLTLSPEIYGSISEQKKVELDGLVYVIDRLPKGIEECRFIKLTSEEGYNISYFNVIVPLQRKRNCYRIDDEQMFIEVTRGRSDIYDILTHLTFLYNESTKIKNHAFDDNGRPIREWEMLGRIVRGEIKINDQNRDVAFAYVSMLLGRTFEETKNAYHRLNNNSDSNNGLFHIVYWLGKLAAEEEFENKEREISFTPALRERVGRHIYGEIWAESIKKELWEQKLFDRPLHIISANVHSVMNSLYAFAALKDLYKEEKNIYDIATDLRDNLNNHLKSEVQEYALNHGMTLLNEQSGANIQVQIFDTSKIKLKDLPDEIKANPEYIQKKKPVLIVMDYAFGEQAYETMDELLKPLVINGREIPVPVESISIMGKAGILEGGKGDIMIPTSFVFEGTADNYPLENEFKSEDFSLAGKEVMDIRVLEGTMITVLGTSLQNKEVLKYFKDSSWKAIGLEMEGAHYQKAIQSQTKVRKNIMHKVVLRYAYYASDNPLISGATLASGSLGLVGVKPTYLITIQLLNKIFNQPMFYEDQ